MSIQTKETPDALSALLKAKGQSKAVDMSVRRPDAVLVQKAEHQITDTPTDETQEDTSETPQEPVRPVTNDEPQDLRDYKKSYFELKQHYDKTVYEERQKNKELEEELLNAKRPVVKPPKTPEEMKAFKEQYGETIDYIRTIVIEELQNDNTYIDVQSKINKVLDAQKQLREEEAFKKLLEIHPDALEIRDDPKFAKWFNEQPEDIKRILATGTDYRAISKQLSLYKLEVLGENPKQKKKTESKKAEEASLGVSTKSAAPVDTSKKMWAKSEIDKISSNYKTWLKYREEIDAARKENRIDYSR